MMIMKNTKNHRTLLENLEANRLSGVEPLSAEQIAGTILDCTLNFVQTFEDRDSAKNQEMMGRIVIAGKMAIEKTINAEIKSVNQD